jgi:apolipoprotein N-acyltransferase
MTVVIGLALGLIVVGLIMAWLSPSMKKEPLVSIVWWVGVVLVVVGLILLLTPVLIWINNQLRAALGNP